MIRSSPGVIFIIRGYVGRGRGRGEGEEGVGVGLYDNYKFGIGRAVGKAQHQAGKETLSPEEGEM